MTTCNSKGAELIIRHQVHLQYQICCPWTWIKTLLLRILSRKNGIRHQVRSQYYFHYPLMCAWLCLIVMAMICVTTFRNLWISPISFSFCPWQVCSLWLIKHIYNERSKWSVVNMIEVKLRVMSKCLLSKCNC